MKELHLDVETRSNVDLNKGGTYKYAESPDFDVLLFGYAVDDGEVNVIDLASGETVPEHILRALTDNSVIKWAHNASFERVFALKHSHIHYHPPQMETICFCS